MKTTCPAVQNMPLQTYLSFISELTSRVPQGVCRVYIPSKLFIAAKMSVLGLILSSYPYLRSAVVQFPLYTCDPKTSSSWIYDKNGHFKKVPFCENFTTQTFFL